MAGELARFVTTTAVERAHDRALDRVERKTDLANARVMSAAQVAINAVQGTQIVCALKREAIFNSPEDAFLFNMIATKAAMAMSAQIDRVGGVS